MLDARKLGVLDSKAEMLIKDFLKTVRSEISKKSETIQRTMGEISSLKKQEQIWETLIRTHVKLETQNLKEEEERQKLFCDDETVDVDDPDIIFPTCREDITGEKPVEAPVKKAKKKTKKKSSFVGDKSEK